jgi:small-conductance mechanosensitive channel
MDISTDQITALLVAVSWGEWLKAALLLFVGLVVARTASGWMLRGVTKRFDKHISVVIGKGVFYTILLLFAASALREIGFSMEVLLGAAGIFTIAVGFASQTVASNLISGLFLITERPFSVGDNIRLGETVGEVISIDLLAIRLRTFDNRMVRVPNESLLKAEIVNLSSFPIRRIDLIVGVAYKEDLDAVELLLLEVAARHPLCLVEPEPVIFQQGFGASSVDLQLSAWVQADEYIRVKNELVKGVKKALDDAGVEIPFPHVTLYTGAATDPFPVQLTEPNDDQPPK